MTPKHTIQYIHIFLFSSFCLGREKLYPSFFFSLYVINIIFEKKKTRVFFVCIKDMIMICTPYWGGKRSGCLNCPFNSHTTHS